MNKGKEPSPVPPPPPRAVGLSRLELAIHVGVAVCCAVIYTWFVAPPSTHFTIRLSLAAYVMFLFTGLAAAHWSPVWAGFVASAMLILYWLWLTWVLTNDTAGVFSRADDQVDGLQQIFLIYADMSWGLCFHLFVGVKFLPQAK